MAKANWCTVSPMSGEGDGTLTVSASGHNGRMGKTTTVTVTAANGTRPSKSFTVVQAGAGVVLTLDSSKPGLPKSGGKVTINGTSNSATLKVDCPQAGLGLVAILKIGGKPDQTVIENSAVPKTVTIPGDPGASGIYSFTLELQVAPSKKATTVTFKINVTPSEESLKKQCTFTLEPGDSSLSINRSEVRLNKEGGAQASGSNIVNVTSNDNWTVS